jgi:hypothetical protein
VPFIIGNEAEPHVISWESGPETDVVIAEHIGYQRLARPLTHRRTVRFEKSQRFWVVEDELRGKGEHVFSFRFHFAPGLEVKVLPDGILEVCDKMSGARLLILAGGLGVQAELEGRFSSSDYGAKAQSVSACWTVQASMPLKAQFVLVPLGSNDDESVAWDWLNMSAASVASESHSTSNQQINLSKLELDFSPGESDC